MKLSFASILLLILFLTLGLFASAITANSNCDQTQSTNQPCIDSELAPAVRLPIVLQNAVQQTETPQAPNTNPSIKLTVELTAPTVETTSEATSIISTLVPTQTSAPIQTFVPTQTLLASPTVSVTATLLTTPTQLATLLPSSTPLFTATLIPATPSSTPIPATATQLATPLPSTTPLITATLVAITPTLSTPIPSTPNPSSTPIPSTPMPSSTPVPSSTPTPSPTAQPATPEPTVESTPTSLSIMFDPPVLSETAVTASGLTLSWVGCEHATEYRILYSLTGARTTAMTTTIRTLTTPPLAPTGTYQVIVECYDYLGNSVFSTPEMIEVTE